MARDTDVIPFTGSMVHIHDQAPKVESFERFCYRIVCMTIFIALFCGTIFTFVFGFMYWIVRQPSSPIVSVEIKIRNPSKFYGTTIRAITGTLAFSTRKLAFGKVEGLVQPKRSERIALLLVKADGFPLYGGGPLIYEATHAKMNIHFSLIVDIHSYAAIFQGMLHKKFSTTLQCDILFDPNVGIAVEHRCSRAK